jgi:hypothetical protein
MIAFAVIVVIAILGRLLRLTRAGGIAGAITGH